MDFGIPPNILEVTDSSQLLGLLTAKNALEDSGYGEAKEELLDRTGVILGVTAGMKLMGSLTVFNIRFGKGYFNAADFQKKIRNDSLNA